ncbi:MAG: DNA phosphorothioation-associated putative methyltransferase, partial [Desulfococcaceae bacterium]
MATGKIRSFDYTASQNPPILHRKETLLPPNHPRVPEYTALTRAEEAEGLYQNPKIIGFKRNWETLLAEKGLAYDDHTLIHTAPAPQPAPPVPVHREKTAITRYNLSRPLRTVFENSLATPDTTFFDFGCGQGGDLKGLAGMGYAAEGWDPAYRPDVSKSPADIVNLGYVLNVIDDPLERTAVLHEAFGLARRLLVVSAMIAPAGAPPQGRRYKDGILTQKNTFQKYFQQDELRQFIEDALHASAVAAGPGIFYVFREVQEQQAFLSERSRRNIDWTGLSRKLYPERPKKTAADILYDTHSELLDVFFASVLQFGRSPRENEFDRYEEFRQKIGTPGRGVKLFIRKFGAEPLDQAAQARREDLLVYLALVHFRKPAPLSQLPPSLKTDIKTFVGPYKQALTQGRDLLFQAGDPAVIAAYCRRMSFGHRDRQALYVHQNLLNDLPPVLRVYVGCAGVLYGDLRIADIIKIHQHSGKVSLLRFDDFENKPLPELQERIKIDLRRQEVFIFDHTTGPDRQLLYFKERFVARDHPLREKWETFGRKLQKALGLDPETIGYGPTKTEYLNMLQERNLTAGLNRRRV